MDVVISVDMEGIAGVATRQQTIPAGHDYPIARALMTAEANAAVAGAFDGGAISAGAKRAVTAAASGAIQPVDVPSELAIEAELRPNGAAEMAALVPGTERTSTSSVRFHAASPREAMDVLIVWSTLTRQFLSR